MRYFLAMWCSAFLFCSSAGAVEPASVTSTAALVNGAVITTAEYRTELSRVLRMRTKSVAGMEPTALALLKKETLETLIGRELLYQESQRKGIRVAAAAVEGEIGKLRKKFKTEKEFKASLEKIGMSEETVTTQISRGMAIQSLIDAEFGATTVVSEADAKSYYISNPDAFLQPGKDREGRAEAALSFEAVRDRIIKQLHRERTEREVMLYLKRLRAESRVEIHLEESGE